MPMNTSKEIGRKSDERKLAVLVEQLRAKLQGGKCATRARMNDNEFLSMFLRVKGCDLDKAQTAVLKYYRHFEAFPDTLANIQTSASYKHLYDANLLTILRQPCAAGTTVCIYRNAAWSPTSPSCGLSMVRQAALFVLQELIRVVSVQEGSATFILDISGFSYAHLRQVKPHDIRFLIQMLQDGFPLRVAAVHLVNYPTIVMGMYYMACGFMKEKLRRRIHLHKDTSSLHEKLGMGKEWLPEGLGGSRALEDVVDRTIEQHLVREDVKYEEYYA